MRPPNAILGSAKLIALCTMASRATGMLRDMLLTHTFGAVWLLDAFWFGFQLPNVFRRLFAEGVLGAAFVPVFTRELERGGAPAAARLLARSRAVLTSAVLVVVLLIELAILLLWALNERSGGAGASANSALLALTALMTPFLLSICVVALYSSCLNSLGSFVPAALTPLILNVGMMAGLLWLGPALGASPQRSMLGVALSVPLAGLLQLAFVTRALRARHLPIGWSLAPRDPTVRRMLGLMGPVAIGQGVLLAGALIDGVLCLLLTRPPGSDGSASWLGLQFEYPLEPGALSVLNLAQRLYQFPLGVLAISLAVAALPTLTRLAARAQWDVWRAELRQALRLAMFVGLLAGTMMIAVPNSIVRLLFEYREFGPQDTARAARVLACYGVGLWAMCAQHVVLRAYYSVSDVRTPVRITCLMVPANIALALALVWRGAVGEAAFAIATSITSIGSVVIGVAALPRAHLGAGALLDGATRGALARMLAAAVVAGAATVAAQAPLRDWAGNLGPVSGRLVETFALLSLGSLVYLLLSALLRLGEPAALLRGWRHTAPAPLIPPTSGCERRDR